MTPSTLPGHMPFLTPPFSAARTVAWVQAHLMVVLLTVAAGSAFSALMAYPGEYEDVRDVVAYVRVPGAVCWFMWGTRLTVCVL